MIQPTDEHATTLPTLLDNTVSLCFAADDHYAPYLHVLITSILAHRDPSRPFEIIILTEDFSEKNRGWFELSLGNELTSVRFLDVSQAMEPYSDRLYTYSHFRKETYYRLLLPQLLPDHSKVLYLDSDMVCLHDVAELFDTDITDVLVAACKDPDTTGLHNGSPFDNGIDHSPEYLRDKLGISNIFEYFQAGVILFNLDEWRASIDVSDVFEFAQREKWHLLDQDVLNHFCYGRVRFVDMNWNVMFDLGHMRIKNIISYSSPELYEAYMQARENPYIVHYAGPIKPWDDTNVDFADKFWECATSSPYYEILLLHRTQKQLNERLDDLAGRLDGLAEHLDVIDDYAHKIDAELLRFERRPISLMIKELIYQKMYTPLVTRLHGREKAKGAANPHSAGSARR